MPGVPLFYFPSPRASLLSFSLRPSVVQVSPFAGWLINARIPASVSRFLALRSSSSAAAGWSGGTGGVAIIHAARNLSLFDEGASFIAREPPTNTAPLNGFGLIPAKGNSRNGPNEARPVRLRSLWDTPIADASEACRHRTLRSNRSIARTMKYSCGIVACSGIGDFRFSFAWRRFSRFQESRVPS